MHCGSHLEDDVGLDAADADEAEREVGEAEAVGARRHVLAAAEATWLYAHRPDVVCDTRTTYSVFQLGLFPIYTRALLEFKKKN